MKIIKSLTLTLLAFASVSLGGCTTDKTEYEPGTDNKGAQAYFATTTTSFSVRTAEEKQESYKEAAALVNRVATRAGFEDDKEVLLQLSRKNTSGAATVNVTVMVNAENDNLFTVEDAINSETFDDGEDLYVAYTVPVVFAADAVVAPIKVSFDIADLKENAEYEFSAALANEADGTLYGASSCTFTIAHVTEVEEVFTNIGVIELADDWYEIGPYEAVIQIHKNDLKAIKEGKTLPYTRFRIPRPMYQLAAAAEDAGDEDEGVADLFIDGDDLLFNLKLPEYDFIYDYTNRTYPAPLADDVTAAGTNYLYAFLGMGQDGSVSTMYYDGYNVFNSTLRGGMYFHPNYDGAYCWLTRNANYFEIDGMLTDIDGGSLYGNYLGYNFTWVQNDLEDDWDTYFSVDYNNDLQYATVGTGSLLSQYYGNVPEESDDEEEDDDVEVIERTLYKGYNDITKTSVYYMADAYADGYGLAIEYDGKAKVAAKQPLGIVLFGKEMFASQSSTYSSKVEFAANGAVSKVVFGIVLHDADGREYVELEETLVFEESKASVKDFIGTFEMFTLEIFSPIFEYVGSEEGDEDEEDSWEQLDPQLDYFVSTVTITLDPENSTKVYISGLIPDYYLAGEDGTLEGTYDVTANCIVIPAQYFNKPAWDLGFGFDLFPYFQPGETDYSYYFDGMDYEGAYWYSTMGTAVPAAALYLDEDGSLYMGSSPTDGSGVAVDGFAVNLHYYDEDSGEFEDLGEYFSTFGYFGMYTPTFTPVESTTRTSAAPVKKSLNFSGRLKKVDISEAKPAKRVAIKR